MKAFKMIKTTVLVAVAILALLALVSCEDCQHELVYEMTESVPSCTEEGVDVYVCALCGTRVEQTTPVASAHEYGEWVVVKKATFSNDGERVRKCTLCDASEIETIAAFGEYPDMILSSTRTDIDLSKYTIVRANISPSFPSAVQAARLAQTIKNATGVEIPCDRQLDAPKVEGSYEILVGETNRVESKAVLKTIEGEGFAIRIVDKKLVIVGSNDVQTALAIQYFIDTYFSEASVSSTLSVRNSTLANNCDSFVLVSGEEALVDIVYDKDLDDDKKHAYTVSEGDICRDYPVQVADLLAARLEKVAGLADDSITVRRSDTVTEKELIVGPVVGDETENSLRASIEADEYAVLVAKDKIVLTAHSDYALQEGYGALRAAK